MKRLTCEYSGGLNRQTKEDRDYWRRFNLWQSRLRCREHHAAVREQMAGDKANQNWTLTQQRSLIELANRARSILEGVKLTRDQRMAMKSVATRQRGPKVPK